MKKSCFVKFTAMLLVLSLLISLLGMAPVTVTASERTIAESNDAKSNNANSTFVSSVSTVEQDKNLLGYGYNITAGKALGRQTLLHQSPILDVKNPELISKFFVDSISTTRAQNQVAYSSMEMAEKMSSGVSGGISAKIAVINCDINALFNKEYTLSRFLQSPLLT